MNASYYKLFGTEVLVETINKKGSLAAGKCQYLPTIKKESCNEYEINWFYYRITISKAT